MPTLEETISNALTKMDPAYADDLDQPADVEDEEATTEDDGAPAEEEDDAEDDGEESDEEEDGDEEDDLVPGDEIEVKPNTVLIIDGRKVTVSEGIELKSTWTKKTQELAQEREQVAELDGKVRKAYEELETWYTQRNEDPTILIGELVSNVKNPNKFIPETFTAIAKALGANYTDALSVAISQGAALGLLDEDFAEHFGVKNSKVIGSKATNAVDNDRIARLERELEEERTARTKTSETVDYERVLDQQIDDIIRTEGLTLAGTERNSFKQELFDTAVKHDAKTLDTAWTILKAERLLKAQQQDVAAKKAAAKKRPTQVINKSGSSGNRSTKPADTKPANTEDAVTKAMAILEAKAAKK